MQIPDSYTTPEFDRIRVFQYPGMQVLLKPREAGGNHLPNWESSPVLVMDEQLRLQEYVTSDCPLVSIRHEEDSWMVSVWEWVPGLGPGDFEKCCTTESEAIAIAMDYFLRETTWFKERLAFRTAEQ